MGGFESNSVNAYITFIRIYIPIWVDLKDGSNLVILVFALWFTFQYGWIWKPLPLPLWFQPDFIYIPIWVDLKGLAFSALFGALSNLHSNMGGFESLIRSMRILHSYVFTFQYGWIWKLYYTKLYTLHNLIYIPIWVDLKAVGALSACSIGFYLHSNMGGFERLL